MSRLHPMLQPYVPSEKDPFDRVKAAHLLNRAGFGGTLAEIDRVVEMGPQRALDWLFDFPDAAADEQSEADVPDLSAIDGYPRNFRELRAMYNGKTPDERMALRQQLQRANTEALAAIVNWWLTRMARGPHPFQEKLTLFWHGHFTTSAREERSSLLMWQQNELLRRQSAGNFREFVRQVSRDPAMIDYLNNQQNRKQRPNENYARELMELFTLGIGNYTEQDIKEAARAFTGWHHDGENFIFRRDQHDFDSKTFMGRTGNFDGDEVIDIILQHRACAPYITSRLFEFFVYESPEPQVVSGLGQILRDARWELRPLLRAMLGSRAFYSERAIGAQIKSPIQLVIGTIRALEIDMPPTQALVGALRRMGQVPLAPPNVKGWPGGRMWINTSTLFVRYNSAVALAGELPQVRGQPVRNALRNNLAPRYDVDTSGSPSAIVDHWVQRLIQRPIAEEKRAVLAEALGQRPGEADVRRMIQLIVSMPEYQLC
jgi:uncharacterized protein (DUF1800 family)